MTETETPQVEIGKLAAELADALDELLEPGVKATAALVAVWTEDRGNPTDGVLWRVMLPGEGEITDKEEVWLALDLARQMLRDDGKVM